MTYVIAEPCVDVLDKGCVEECPVDCIYEGTRMLYIHPDECVDYTKANVDFFNELGSPGGASKVGKTDNDPAWIKALPPQGE